MALKLKRHFLCYLMTSPAVDTFLSIVHDINIFLKALALEDFCLKSLKHFCCLKGFTLDQVFGIFDILDILEVWVVFWAISLPLLMEEQVLVTSKRLVTASANNVLLVNPLNVILQTCQRFNFLIADVTIYATFDQLLAKRMLWHSCGECGLVRALRVTSTLSLLVLLQL